MNEPRPLVSPTAGEDLLDIPSLFFVSLPKSGTVYTWYTLEATTGLKMPEFHLLEGWENYTAGRDFSCPDLYACGDYNTQMLLPSGMKHYLKGHIFGAHMQASYHNMRILEESGIRKITVLLRDPRDAFVSWVHHLRNLGPTARNYHSKIYHIPRDYYDWSLEQQFDYQVRTFLPIAVNWVEGWLDYYASADRKIEILFVYYDELKREPVRYIRRIAEFHGLQKIDLSKIAVPEPGKMHFRKGQHEQWREDFSLANQKLADELMKDRLPRGMEAAAKCHPGLVAAAELLAAEKCKEAAAEAMRGITQFPNYWPGYELLFEAAEKQNIETSRLRSQAKAEIGSSSVAGSFIYRYELVDSCGRLVHGLAA